MKLISKLAMVTIGFLSLSISCSKVDEKEDTDESEAQATVEEEPKDPTDGGQTPVDEVKVEEPVIIETPPPEARAFLQAADLSNPNATTLELYPEEMRIFLNSDRGFQNPLLPVPEGQNIIADEFCPETMWAKLSATIYQGNTLLIDQSFSYNCEREPQDSTINFKSLALVAGKFYLHVTCPETDLSSFAGEGVQSALPLLAGSNPKFCPNDTAAKVLMQYKFEVKNDISFTLLTSTPVRTQEHSIFRYSFSGADLAPCQITKEGDAFNLAGCEQTKWQETLSFKRWRDNLLNYEQEGTETTDFTKILYKNLSFSGAGKSYSNGEASFEKNNWAGTLQYLPETSPTVQAKSGDNELNEPLSW